MTKSKKRSSRKHKIDDFARDTTIHGIPQVLSGGSSKLVRATWCVLIVIALALAIALTLSLWTAYVNGDVSSMTVNFNMRDRALLEAEIPIMYCPSNWVDPEKVILMMTEYNMSFHGISYALRLVDIDPDSFMMLKIQLNRMGIEFEDYEGYITQHQVTERLLELRKLPHNYLHEFISDIVAPIETIDTVHTDGSMRGGRYCYELRANSSAGNIYSFTANSLRFQVRQPILENLNVRISPVPGSLNFSTEMIMQLDDSVGFGRRLTLKHDDWPLGRSLVKITDTFSIRINTYRSAKHCAVSKDRGNYVAQFSNIRCMEKCRLNYTDIYVRQNHSCTTSDLIKPHEDNMIPCSLTDLVHWYNDSSGITARWRNEILQLAAGCIENCKSMPPICDDYRRTLLFTGRVIEEDTNFVDGTGLDMYRSEYNSQVNVRLQDVGQQAFFSTVGFQPALEGRRVAAHVHLWGENIEGGLVEPGFDFMVKSPPGTTLDMTFCSGSSIKTAEVKRDGEWYVLLENDPSDEQTQVDLLDYDVELCWAGYPSHGSYDLESNDVLVRLTEMPCGELVDSFDGSNVTTTYRCPNSAIFFEAISAESDAVSECVPPVLQDPWMEQITEALMETNQCSIKAKGGYTRFYSPGYPNPYPADSRCFYRFEAPANDSVEVRVLFAQMEAGHDHLHVFDGVFSSYSELTSYTGCTLNGISGAACSNRGGAGWRLVYEYEIQSSTNVVLLMFTSDSSTNFMGFEIELRAVKSRCSESDETERSGWIESEIHNHTITHVIDIEVAQISKVEEYFIVGFVDLVSSAGGIFSLFLGCSALSLVHMCWFCAQLFRNSNGR